MYRNIALMPIFMFCYFSSFCYLCNTLDLNKGTGLDVVFVNVILIPQTATFVLNN